MSIFDRPKKNFSLFAGTRRALASSATHFDHRNIQSKLVSNRRVEAVGICLIRCTQPVRGVCLCLETKTTTVAERLVGYLIRRAAVCAEFSSVSARRNLIDNLFSEPLISHCFKRGRGGENRKMEFQQRMESRTVFPNDRKYLLLMELYLSYVYGVPNLKSNLTRA